MKNKIVLICIVFIIIAGIVFADYTTPDYVYDFEQDPATSDLIEQVEGKFNSFADQVQGTAAGINNLGWDFERDNCDIVNMTPDYLNNSYRFSMNFWIKQETVYSWSEYMSGLQSRTTNDWPIEIYSGDSGLHNLRARTNFKGGSLLANGQVNGITDYTGWQMITVSYNSTNWTAYHNGSFVRNAVTTTQPVHIVSWILGAADKYDKAPETCYDGIMDELYFYNESLSQDDVTALWNNGAGYFYGAAGLATPTITLPTPASGTRINQNITLNVSHNSGTNDVQYYLYLSNTTPLNETHLYVNNATRTVAEYKEFYTNVSAQGTWYYKWRVQNISSGEFSSNTSQRTFIIDTITPTITLNHLNHFNATNRSNVNQPT